MSSQFGRSTRVAGEEGRDRARIQLALSIMAIIRKDRRGEEREEGKWYVGVHGGRILHNFHLQTSTKVLLLL